MNPEWITPLEQAIEDIGNEIRSSGPVTIEAEWIEGFGFALTIVRGDEAIASSVVKCGTLRVALIRATEDLQEEQ